MYEFRPALRFAILKGSVRYVPRSDFVPEKKVAPFRQERSGALKRYTKAADRAGVARADIEMITTAKTQRGASGG
jgi:hypothetical protein